MEETYEARLDAVVARIPEEGGVIALVAMIEADQAAALASDLAQSVGRGRTGHTLLLSFEDGPSALDHEIGVEGGAGLTEVLAGKTAMAKVAAHGRARGFVYVPAGDSPAGAAALLGSTAFRSLGRNAVSRGGTVLAFVPHDVLHGASPPVVDGVVWLGSPPDDAGVPSGWTTLGTLLPPGTPTQPAIDRGHDPTPVARPSRSRRTSSQAERTRSPKLLTVVLVAIVLSTIAMTTFILVRTRTPASFLPQNDSLWLAPEGADTSPDSR